MRFLHTKKVLISALISILIMSSSLHSKTGKNIEEKLDQYINAYVKTNKFSGSILVAQNNRIVVNRGYGMADYGHKVPNSSKTIFRIGSLTKQFTAMAVLMLEEKGRLDLNDPLSKYMPDYPEGDKIRISHLLTHTSGIPNHTELPDFNRERRVYDYALHKTIATFKNKPLNFSPGEKFQYSNSGYLLLGYIIEKVSGMPYAKYIEHRIFKALKMVDSGYLNPAKIIENEASGYNRSEGRLIKADYRNLSNAHASGALYSTVKDLYLWDRALYTDKLVKKSSLKKMFTPFKSHYGYGWGIVNIFKRKMVGHNGETEGFRSNISRFINDDTCIIVLSNFEHTPVGKMSMDLAAILFGKKYSLPQTRKKVKLSADILKDYVGKYELSPKFYFLISSSDTRLFCQPKGQKKLEIHPESKSTFFIKEVNAKISFVRDKSGKVEKLILNQNSRKLPAKKTE